MSLSSLHVKVPLQVFINAVILCLISMTLCYSQVTENWVARYDGPETNIDKAYAMTIDVEGNIYVAGYSFNSVTYQDYTTVKYDPLGNLLWVSNYDGPGDYWDSDIALDIEVDPEGSVFVTGISHSDETNNDFATVKYDQGGNEIWTARYDGEQSDDVAAAMTVDRNSNVFVTGKSWRETSFYDLVTIKYDSTGHEMWSVIYNSPDNGWEEAYAIIVDYDFNVYVLGASDGYGTGSDFVTIKYDSSGTELWAARYDGPDSMSDIPSDFVIDDAGNVYVTGWTVSDSTLSDYTTIKYDQNGDEVWIKRYNGPRNYNDWARAITLDGNCNIYVTGESWGSGTAIDFATLKYDEDGNELWLSRYHGIGNSWDCAVDIAVDMMGNAYVTGWSFGNYSYQDYLTVKYDIYGFEEWITAYDGPAHTYDEPVSLVVDGYGNVFVTGSSVGEGTDYDFATLKYSQGLPHHRQPVYTND